MFIFSANIHSKVNGVWGFSRRSFECHGTASGVRREDFPSSAMECGKYLNNKFHQFQTIMLRNSIYFRMFSCVCSPQILLRFWHSAHTLRSDSDVGFHVYYLLLLYEIHRMPTWSGRAEQHFRVEFKLARSLSVYAGAAHFLFGRVIPARGEANFSSVNPCTFYVYICHSFFTLVHFPVAFQQLLQSMRRKKFDNGSHFPVPFLQIARWEKSWKKTFCKAWWCKVKVGKSLPAILNTHRSWLCIGPWKKFSS